MLAPTGLVVSKSPIRRLFGNDIDAALPPPPGDTVAAMGRLAGQASTPPRLRVEAAVVALPPAAAADMLGTMAATRTLRPTVRAAAAGHLVDLDPTRGLAAQRTIVDDRRIPRPVRWAILAVSDLLELDDFSVQRARLTAAEAGRWTLFRLIRTAFTEPTNHA